MSPAAGLAVRPIRILASAMWLVGFAGCYSASTLPEGAPCQRSEQCPEPQRCVLGSCSLSAAPPVDAPPPPPPDAMVDAMVDAMAVPCVPTGLSCASGTPLVFQCGSHCWAKCTDTVMRAAAETRCTGWTGVLGEIVDANEDSCVAMKIGTAVFWFGASQGNGAARPSDKWTWNGDATKLFNYTSWAPGKPDDGADGVENGQEQCATLRQGGAWDDDNCTSQLGFFCTRPLFR